MRQNLPQPNNLKEEAMHGKFPIDSNGDGNEGSRNQQKIERFSRSDWERGIERREPIGWIKALLPDGEGRHGGGSRASKESVHGRTRGGSVVGGCQITERQATGVAGGTNRGEAANGTPDLRSAEQTME
ncbi:hypothetical protein RHGRI_018640 [Rhododendron griersonianum]|uniref:Uncharacterized protein n=1 Tax=Rhododendron griersonianum TaxID=479676 RepID=A0AAV6K2B9_9ERIC|nr:hypothetical protein RHGRI_018640 [Rhododendron griersonianum]